MSTAKRVTLVVALLGVLGLAAGIAFANNAPPTPTISTSTPSSTSATSASFSFTDSQSNVTYACSLDGSSYAACTSPKAYANLPAGTHTFQVEAMDKSNNGHTSSPASYSWSIVTSPPSITITFPSNGGDYNASAWSARCGGPGVCGTASDLSGVTSVIVSIKNAGGKYWTGSSYASSTEVYNGATLTNTTNGASWFYSLPLPSPDGQYTLHVRATDAVGLQTPSASPATSVFTIDTAPPPQPTITASPANPTTATSATFNFTDTEAGVTFQCQLDGGSWQSCSSPTTYSSLSTSTHTFNVRAVDGAANASAATQYSWQIVASTNKSFAISGNASGLLYPGGASRPISVSITNPNNQAIYVTSLTATVQSSGLPTGCGTGSFQITQSSIPSAGVQVPANGSVILPTQGAAAPSIQMVDTGTNQNVCRNATVTFSFTGSAHS